MSEEERRRSQASDARSGQQQVRCWNELAKASRPSTEGGERWTLKRPIRILPPHSRQRNTQRRTGKKKKEADRTRGTTAEVLKVEEEVVGKKLLNFSPFKWPHHPSQSVTPCLPASLRGGTHRTAADEAECARGRFFFFFSRLLPHAQQRGGGGRERGGAALRRGGFQFPGRRRRPPPSHRTALPIHLRRQVFDSLVILSPLQPASYSSSLPARAGFMRTRCTNTHT